MKKIDRAVEIIRELSDEELKDFLTYRLCPSCFKIKNCEVCNKEDVGSCEIGWNEEVEE